jgi:DNA (cytosine-5)-methyltransferase 1
LENVAALLTRGLDRVLGTLAEIGYDAEWHCVPAAYVGAPHIRDRVFIIAYGSGVGIPRIKLKKVSRFESFSWLKNVRRVEDLPERCNLYPSKLCRSGDGIPARVDRLRGLGNAVVPQVAELVGKMVLQRLRSGKSEIRAPGDCQAP